MAVVNLGSIASDIQARVDNIPESISGLQLTKMVDEERLFMEEFTGDSIGSVAIAEKYQPALTKLATAALLEYMELTGADVSEIKLGDFTSKKGSQSNISSSHEKVRKDGMNKLAKLGRAMTFRKVIGGPGGF